LFPNQMCCAFGYLFVCAGTKIYVFSAADLVYRKRVTLSWADEIQGLDTVTINGVRALVALFVGSSVVSGPVVADSSSPAEAFGQFVRSGVAVYKVDDVSYVTGPAPMPQGTANFIPPQGNFELHYTFRFSEYSATRPRGCIPFSFGIDSLGDIYVGHTNQGFGYSPLLNASHRPDGALGPYLTVTKAILTKFWAKIALPDEMSTYLAPALDAGYGIDGATGAWQQDTTSYRRSFNWNGAQYYNDIPRIVAGARDPGVDSDAPSVYALKLDEASDRLYVGGRRPSPTHAVPNVYCLRASDGAALWSHDLKGLVQQNAISVDPTSGNPVFGFLRTAGWDDNGAPSVDKAEVIELDRDTGDVVRYFDLSDAVNLNGYATTDGGFGCYDVAVNARGQVLVALAPYRYDD